MQNKEIQVIKLGFLERGTGEHQSNQVFSGGGISPTLSATDYKNPYKVVIKIDKDN